MNVLERIKKLLRTAENADNEHEAALAASRARALMAQYEIHEAELADDGGVEVRDPITERHEVTDTKKRVAWHMSLTLPVVNMFGAHAYTVGGRIALYGRLSAVQAAGYTIQYLIRETELACDAQAPSKEYSRGYRNAWKLGYAHRVAMRLNEQTEREQKRERQQLARAQNATREEHAFDVSDTGGTEALAVIPQPSPDAGVLMRVAKQREEVREGYDEYKKDWGASRSIGQISSGSGYKDGKAAGGRAKLPKRDNAQGRLPKGQGVLK